MKTMVSVSVTAALLATCATACVSTHESVMGAQHSQVQTRNYQSRSFETGDRETVLRSIVSTMQDLGFIIGRADEKLGVITGTSFANGSKLTVSVRAMGPGRTVVRANAQAGLREIADPAPYQNFFNALSQSLFLEAHAVE
jgi:hypothetical protein